MKNKLIDLNNHMFAQIERLSDEDLTGEQLTFEINRSKAIETIAAKVIDNANLALRAHAMINEGHIRHAPEMIGMIGDE